MKDMNKYKATSPDFALGFLLPKGKQMKNPYQEIMDAIAANAGNRLTPELIAGMQARINQIFAREAQQIETKEQSEE